MAPGLCESESGAEKGRMMRLSEKQQMIIELARGNNGEFTTSDIHNSEVNDYYSGASRYISAILKGMVDSKKIIRVKIGHYRLLNASDIVIKNQETLF